MANRHTSTLLLCALAVLSLVGAASCRQDTETAAVPSDFEYPDSKFWAHCVSTVALGRERSPLFDGLEVDVNYSESQDKIFMGHELYDTIHGLTLDMWLDSLPQPVANRIWLDTKNITPDNASRIAHRILAAVRRHGIQDRVMVESQDAEALRTIKDSGLHVILWVDNPYWSGRSREEWTEMTNKQIERLHPDALSGDFHIFPLLPDTYPEQNIHIWDTPRTYDDTNVAHSLHIAAHPSVKVVLVDYPEAPERWEGKKHN